MFRSVSRVLRPIQKLSIPTNFTRSIGGARRTIVQMPKDDEELRGIIGQSKGKLIVVDWFATWCGPCRAIAPVVEKLSDSHTNVVFIKADIDQMQDAAAEAGVSAVPTFHFIRDNQLIAEFSGADQKRLLQIVNDHGATAEKAHQ